MANNDDDILRARLAQYLKCIPKKVRQGSWNTARDFKQWAGEAKKALSRGNPQVIASLLNRYEAWL